MSDADLRHIVSETIDIEHPREFFWALMDYGSYLKKQGVGRINKSSHYKKQSVLKGSVREVRGQIIRTLTAQDMSEAKLRRELHADERYTLALAGLIKDGLVSYTNSILQLTK